ncbi:hypothetical protein H6F93_00045 [Leptolyngbya sp. FACHB-671]|uniref:hypothetical protein n=1 Tax=Leptolyngbya sp. FACHB-671 TaxID=2692812 RepID=UPI0016833231|nr:hypothetical protein [Leptolyngbya sp. FACHB-671]MBD2065945.1 hypothetical protein [Leptolyngbya sp. FACHB-671]
MSTPPATYSEELIPQPPQRWTRAQQLELLMWHPLFTGKCPQCGQARSQDQQLALWTCGCGWKDETE